MSVMLQELNYSHTQECWAGCGGASVCSLSLLHGRSIAASYSYNHYVLLHEALIYTECIVVRTRDCHVSALNPRLSLLLYVKGE